MQQKSIYSDNINWTQKFVKSKWKKKVLLFVFLDPQITKLKIDSNPFAKGFRDSSRLTDMERYRGFWEF